jgi:gamma-glutamyltranspeptidase / glutathione hydrolase
MKEHRPCDRIWKRWVPLLILGLVAVFVVLYLRTPATVRRDPSRAPKPEEPAKRPQRRGMVATANRHATEAGVNILRDGGNAVDAAIAAAFTLGVVEPFASGIGGGGFMLIYSAKTRQVVAIDYRETAPLRATPRMYLDASGQVTTDRMIAGHSSVAVPGTVAGLTVALKNYGSLDLKSVLAPAIDIAEKGYEVTPLLSGMMENTLRKLSRFPATADIYLRQGRPHAVGDQISCKDLAATYRLIAKEGADAFYKGVIAETIEKEMASSDGGLVTKEDLSGYEVRIRPPVYGTYRGYEIYSMGPPSSGGTHIIELLNIFEGYDMASVGLNTARAILLMADGMKQVFAERARWMGDPDFVTIPLEDLLSKEHAKKLRTLSGDLSTASGWVARALGEPQQTTHLSVVDNDGNVVALTQTINSFFGSGVVVPGTGILLNNEMNDFAPQPGGQNSIQPRKRPVSSMSPTLLFKEGRPYVAIGMPGATRIITVLPQIVMNIIDHRLNLQEAVNAPRIHCMANQEISMESRIATPIRETLIREGYHIDVRKDFDLYFGGAQGVMIDGGSGKLHGGADPRREGFVLGL